MASPFDILSGITVTKAAKNAAKEPEKACEVFRNNTTAVEVIVKEVPKNKKQRGVSNLDEVVKLQEENSKLKKRIRTLEGATHNEIPIALIVKELSRQLAMSREKEIEVEANVVNLQLENEKLKAMLHFKTNLIRKMKHELNSLRKVLKAVVKSIVNGPQFQDGMPAHQDVEYYKFEKQLKTKLINFSSTGDDVEFTEFSLQSSVSRDTNASLLKSA